MVENGPIRGNNRLVGTLHFHDGKKSSWISWNFMDFQWSFVRKNAMLSWYEVSSSWVKTQLISQHSKLECLSQPEDGEIAKDSSGGGRSNARYLGVGGQRQGLLVILGLSEGVNITWKMIEILGLGIFFDETDDGRCWDAICLIPLSMVPPGKKMPQALAFSKFNTFPQMIVANLDGIKSGENSVQKWPFYFQVQLWMASCWTKITQVDLWTVSPASFSSTDMSA